MIIQINAQSNDSIPVLKVLGIFTNNPIITQKVDIDDTNYHLYLWENTLKVITTTPYEGENVLPFASNGTTTWFGFGFFASNGINLTEFANGYLHVAIKVNKNATNEFWLGIGGSQNREGKVEFKPGNDPYGFKRDGNWHKLIIPMRDLTQGGLLLDSCGNYFMMGGGGTIGLLAIDDIYFSTDSVPVDNPLLPEDDNTNIPNTNIQNSNGYTNIVENSISNGYFQLQNACPIGTIKIYDIHGKLLKEIHTGKVNGKIDLTNYQLGIYVLRLESLNGVMVQKIFKY